MTGKHFLVTAALCTLAGCGPTPQPTDEAIAELSVLKKEVWPDIYAAKDAEALNEFLSDDFVLIGGGQVTPKAEELVWLMNPGDWSAPEDFSYKIVDIIMITPDAAMVYGKGSSTRTNELGEPCSHSYWSSNTLRRVDGVWHPVASHVSDVQCAVIGD